MPFDSSAPDRQKYNYNQNKFKCRKLAQWQHPEDVKFSKKISERFDAQTVGDSQNVKVDYYRQPSKEIARDPRDLHALPKTKKDFEEALLIVESNDDGRWIGGEPNRYILIDRISSKQVRTDLNLFALLEDSFGVGESEISKIWLHTFNDHDRICALVQFASGYRAWDFIRKFKEKPCGYLWIVKSDADGKSFESIRKMEEKQEKPRFNLDSKIADQYGRTSISTPQKQNNSQQYRNDKSALSCNPFVPCVKIPFSCESSLPFRLDEKVLLSVFPEQRFSSVSNVEEGDTSWHIHFGREIDVVEADRMLQKDTFEWKGHEFYFEKWKLTKNGHSWDIPEHYKTSSRISDKTEVKSADYLEDVKVDFQTATLPSIEDGDADFLKLSKFVKKRPHSPTDDCEEMSRDSGIKVKVKRKPIKRNSNTPIVTEIPGNAMEIVEIGAEIECPILSSGSARTEGFFRLSVEEKRRVRFDGILEAFSSSSHSNVESSSSGGDRSSRIQNRRPQIQIPSTALDLFKVSPLQSTQKLVALRNSSIHSFGLVLMEPADPGDLIIEYVGELVRASVANIREWKYEREFRGDGIASSYLFRLDGIMVIDATYKGNLARFINHSCDPNCVAKTITLNGSKRIVMYAKKSIRTGEEITYDYKFPTEKDPKKKVKCLCGSHACRKYLN